MMIISHDYWQNLIDQKTGVKPLDKVEIYLSGSWTDVTDQYIGGATFDQEKERAPDKISAGDTRYTFDNTADTFTKTDASSIFYNVVYQGAKIRFSIGFPGIGYFSQSVMRIKDVKWDFDEQRCYIEARELMQRVVDEDLNVYPSGLIPVANAGNTGNGTITDIKTKPFATVSETWTLTCTVANTTFSVVGSVSGNIGNATVGAEFSTGGLIKFTLTAGGVGWVAGGSPDTFTFTTYQYPEYTTTDPAKIIWNLLTGYVYDTDVQSNWHDRVLELDHTKSTDNTDINYTSFVNAIANIDDNLTGYVDYDKNAAQVIEEIIIHFLGATYTDNQGKIAISSYKPSFGAVLLREFSDDKKVFTMDSEEDTAEIINQVTVKCKRSASWAWSNITETTDDVYVATNATSISDYGIKNPFTWDDFYWYSVNRAAQEWFADRLVDKFGNPPLEINFETGLDAIRHNLADRIKFTDSRTSYSNKIQEISKIQKDFESSYKTIKLYTNDTGTDGVKWCFLGSSVDEGDEISPQASDYDSATESDKQFCYLSQTGGSGSTGPDYFLF